jgi:dTDP-L-rhamnose 4-epimerase
MILVTGGAGFIGSHTVDALLVDGHRVRVLDIRPSDDVHPDTELIEGDIRDPGEVAAALDGVTAVCHLAAMVGLGSDVRDVADYAQHNDLGTAVLLRALTLRGFRGRLVLASSMVVYGEGRYRCARHGIVAPGPRSVSELEAGRFDPPCPACGEPLAAAAVPETAPLDPRNIYAATKLHQEHLCFCFARETGTPVTALRYHNVYGPRMPRDTPYAGVAAIFASALAAGEPPRVFEDGAQLRDFVHVRDVARANVLALTASEPPSGAFNVASGRPRSVGEMARAMAGAAGSVDPVVTGEFRRGDVRHVFAAAERARTGLGFRASEDFEAGMRELAATSWRPGAPEPRTPARSTRRALPT